MAFTERMIAAAAQATLGTTTITFRDQSIDLGQRWQRITMRDAIKQFAEIDYMDYPLSLIHI